MGLYEEKDNLQVKGDLDVKGKIVGPNVPIACDTVVTEKTFGQAEAPGASKNFSRCDHTHGTPPEPFQDFILEYGNSDLISETNGIPTAQTDIRQGLKAYLLHDGWWYESPA